MKMYHGQRIVNLYTNNETKNKKKEMTIMEKLQMFKAHPIILAATSKAEELVRNWYEKHSKKKLKTQTQEEELQFFKAPPVIGEGE